MSNDIIKVALCYQNQTYQIEVQKYKKLKSLKEKAYKLFYPIKYELELKYNNKSLTKFLDQSIGMVFTEKSFIKIVAYALPGVNRSMKLKPKIKIAAHISPSNKNNNNKSIEKYNRKEIDTSVNIKEVISRNDNLSSINSKNYSHRTNSNLAKIKTESNTNNNSNSKNKNKLDFYEELNLKKNGRKKLPPIKTENNENEEMNNKQSNNDIIAFNNCSECLYGLTSVYCRNCNKFLCLDCSNKNHYDENVHKLIEIDDNEKINVNRYKEEINKELYIALNSFENSGLDNNGDTIDTEGERKNFEKLINNLTDVAKGMKESINLDEKYYNEDKERIGDELNNIKNELNNENYEEKNNEDGFKFFKELNAKDKNINYLMKEYNCSSTVEYMDNKIQKLFGDIEDEIDKVIFELEEKVNFGEISDNNFQI